MPRASLRARRPGASGAEACVEGPGAASSRIDDALLAAPPSPWLRPSISQICCGARWRDTLVAAVAGKAYPAVSIEIDPERAAEFARAIGADPDDGVPPTYAAVYSLGVTVPKLFGDDEAAIDFAHLLHAEQEFAWTRHPRGGETVTSTGRVASDITRRGMRFVTFETDTTGSDGAPVCTSRALFIVRS